MGLRVYTVHLPSALSKDGIPVLVKEGFSWGAFLLGVVWALWHRLWIEAAALLALFLAVGVIADFIALSEPVESAVMLAITILIGCSGNDWRRESLRQRGYQEAGVVVGPNADDALRRFLDLRAIDAGNAPTPSVSYQEPAALYAAPVSFQGATVGAFSAMPQTSTAEERLASRDQAAEPSPASSHLDPDRSIRDDRPQR